MHRAAVLSAVGVETTANAIRMSAKAKLQAAEPSPRFSPLDRSRERRMHVTRSFQAHRRRAREDCLEGKRALVIGSSGGIGRALVDALRSSGKYGRIYAASRNRIPAHDDVITPITVDILDESALSEASRAVAQDGDLDLLIVATGLLHGEGSISPEKSFRHIHAAAITRVFAVNSIGPALVAKHFLPVLAAKRRVAAIFLSARVGSIADNRLGGWHSYRASKAALNALVRCFAIELRHRNPEAIVAVLHPGTVDTPLSEPFQARIPPTSLFAAESSAAHMLAVINQLIPADSGGFFGWDGRPIPF